MTNQIAQELLVKIGRLPGMRYKYHKQDGHILIVDTAAGVADRVMVFGHGASALEHLHMAVMAVEGVLAHMGYEDPASGNIHVNRWMEVRFLKQELVDAGIDPDALKQALTAEGNQIISDNASPYFHRHIRYLDDPEKIVRVKFSREGHTESEEDSDVFFFGVHPLDVPPGMSSAVGGWEIVDY
jgi:hypothetical protein